MSIPPSKVHIRPYRPADFDVVKRLFYDGMAYGPLTPAIESTRAVYKNPYSILLYLAGALSTLSPFFFHRWFSQHSRLRILAPLLGSGIVAAYLLWIPRQARKMMVAYCDQCMKEDMKDIVAHYGLKPIKDESGETKYEPVGKGCFWVAEHKGEVVGCVGLDNSDQANPLVGELRRLSISSRHRNLGIASLLIKTLVSFARERGLSTLRLGTSSFQPAAVRLYQKHGWKITESKPYKVDVIPVTFQLLTLGYTL
ncbi:hypothetical protein AAF712_004805 [Marasmius tenuissimus]|uniref:N-acetyltransferase domain-containing protein n=1 Tax=Marasmius tenuissimus TaxID=585030 RepID=A0ABR3A2F0_9AGAR